MKRGGGDRKAGRQDAASRQHTTAARIVSAPHLLDASVPDLSVALLRDGQRPQQVGQLLQVELRLLQAHLDLCSSGTAVWAGAVQVWVGGQWGGSRQGGGIPASLPASRPAYLPPNNQILASRSGQPHTSLPPPGPPHSPLSPATSVGMRVGVDHEMLA